MADPVSVLRGGIPDEGELPGQATLLPQYEGLGPTRPFGPGEYVTNPNGSWSNEITTTVQKGDAPDLNSGEASVIPTLWLKNGKPVRVSEDEAAALAAQSGLQFPHFKSNEEAEAFSTKREANWQTVKPEENASVGQLWTRPTTDRAGLPVIAGHDAASDARAAGYEWGDIQGHVEDATQAALAAGYGQDEIDAHLGYSDPSGLQSRLQLAAKDLNIVKPLPEAATFGGRPDLPEPGKSVGPLTPDLAAHYRDALINGEVKTPHDFASAYTGALGLDPAHAKVANADIAKQLPPTQDFIDHALGILHANGETLDADSARTTRANLADYWSKTGQAPGDVPKDPILHDAMTTPNAFFSPSTEFGPAMPPEDIDKIISKQGEAVVDWFKGIGKDLMERFAPPKPGESLFQRGMNVGLAVTGAEGGGGVKAAVEGGEAVAKAVPAWVMEHRQAAVDLAGKLGLTDQISDMAKQGKTAKEITSTLGDKLDVNQVRAVREHLGLSPAEPQPALPDLGKMVATPEAAEKALKVDLSAKPAEPPPEAPKPETKLAFKNGRYQAVPVEAPKPTTETPAPAEAAAKATVDVMGKPVDVTDATPEAAHAKIAERVQEAGHETVAKLDETPRIIRPVDLPPPPGAADVKPFATGLEDSLYRLRGRAQATVENLNQWGSALPDEIKEAGKDRAVRNETEERGKIGGETAPWSDKTQAYQDAVRPISDRLRENVADIKARLAGHPDAVAELEEGLNSPEQGYMRRVWANFDEWQKNQLDPEKASANLDVITGTSGQGTRTLGSFTPSGQQRQFYVHDYGEGNRTWGIDALDKTGKKFGDTGVDAASGENYTIKPATTTEIEANMPGLKVSDNHLVDLMEGVAQTQRVRENLDVLDEHKDKLEDAGLFKPHEFGQAAPDGMQPVDIPGMKGWAHPWIANILNDYYKTSGGDLERKLETFNSLLTRSLFVTPFAHSFNVGAAFAVNRGWQWLNPVGYGSLLKHSIAAWQDVETKSPFYLQALNAGAALQHLGATTQGFNFRQLMLQRVYHEMANDPHTWGDYAKSVGLLGASDLVKATYKWSNEHLWKMGDVMMVSRLRELMAGGKSLEDAIPYAEKDIFNYRVPTQVATRLLGNTGAHALGEAFRRPLVQMFGRYHYGMIRSLAGIVRDTISPSATMAERLDAVGKMTAIGAFAFGVHPAMNWALRQIPGNDDNHVSAPWPGQMGWLRDAYMTTTGQQSWLATTGKLLSLAPVWDILNTVRTGKDVFGKNVVDATASTPAKVAEGLEGAASHVYPAGLLMEGLRKGWDVPVAKAFGLEDKTEPDPVAAAKWQKRDAAVAARREMNDPITHWIDSVFGTTPQVHSGHYRNTGYPARRVAEGDDTVLRGGGAREAAGASQHGGRLISIGEQ